MVRSFPVKGWGGLVVEGNVVALCASCHLGLVLVSNLSCVSYGMECVTLVGMGSMERPVKRCNFSLSMVIL